MSEQPQSLPELGVADRHAGVALLRRRLSPKDLRHVVDALRGQGERRRRKGVEWIVAETEHAESRLHSRLPEDQLAEFLVDVAGVDLLTDREIRYRLARSATAPELEELHEYPSGARGRGGAESKAQAVAQRNWHAGKSWPKHFTRTLGFPAAFAGLEGLPTEPESEEIVPFRPLQPLQDFQLELKAQVTEVLQSPPGTNRGILTLPTGAGKTRTAVEALHEWRLSKSDRPSVIWIAQSDELCEQAVQAFREVWVDLGHRSDAVRENLKLYRLWGGGRGVPAAADVIVASIQKLHAIWRGEDRDSRREELAAMSQGLGAVIVDEAHRMLADSYQDVLGFLGINLTRGAASERPLLGLTATPIRGQEDETRRLAAQFHGRLLRPSSLGPDVVETLRARGVLSRPVHRVVEHGGATFSLRDDPKYVEHFERFNEFHPDLLERIGEERARNRRLLEILFELPDDWPVLFFGCSVEHATAIAVLLRRRGRTAAMVASSTRAATRRFLIEQFRAGRISVLCNFGVLTTGFDAPKIRALVVARPTASPVLYEQMIGRGMRGPVFGGKEDCLVVDVEDNIRYAGGLAYRRYDKYWTGRLSA